MMKIATAALGLTLAASVPALAIEEPYPVSGVKVEANLENVEVTDFAQFYPNFSDDLEKVIWATVDNPMTDGSQGFQIDIKVTQLSLNGNPMGTDGQFNSMSGIATYTFDGGDGPAGSYPIEVTATSGDAPAGAIVVAPSESDYYAAMLDAFANGVENQLNDLSDPEPAGNIRN